MNILLIEPDKVLAALYSQAFQRKGHKVVATPSAQAAIYLADQHQPDVVVLELQLPHHNGVEFLYEFRSYHEWLRLPVIVHTHVPGSELAMAATLRNELRVSDVLYKPATSLRQLCAAVSQAVPAGL